MKGWRSDQLAPNMRESHGLWRCIGQIALGCAIVYLTVAFFLHITKGPTGFLYGMIGIVAALPLIVPGVLGLFPALVRSIHAMQLEPWQGRYYEFGGYQVRILERDNMLWVSLADLEHALRDKIRPGMLHTLRLYLEGGFAGTRGQALSEHGVRILLAARTDTTSHKFSRWFEQQVCAPWYKRKKLEADPDTARSSQE